jgi:threonylcarbamoyladenosine tRNA methylthiotransferase CDKAL1
MKKLFIYILPVCDKRPLDANRVKNYFLKNNYKIVNKPKDADLIIFFTCAAFESTAKKSLEKIKEFQKYKAELIVSGCLPDIEKDELTNIFNGKIISTKNLDNIDSFFPENKIKFKDIKDANIPFENINTQTIKGFLEKSSEKINLIKNTYMKLKNYIIKKISEKNTLLHHFLVKDSVYYIRVCWGCTGNCSYCSIKKAVGALKSKPLDICVREFNEGLEKGNTDFLITADETGGYGLDINTSLIDLINEFTKIKGNYKITIRALKPGWLVKHEKELTELLKTNKIKQLEIPIQSGSKKILTLMNRFSDTDKIRDSFLRLKQSSNNLKFFSHLIFGFPSETWQDFESTMTFIKESKIDMGLVFPFSCRKGTIAETIEPKISKKEVNKRFKYARKYLKKNGYNVLYLHYPHIFFFVKKRDKS